MWHSVMLQVWYRVMLQVCGTVWYRVMLQVWYSVDTYEKFTGGRQHYITVNLEKVIHQQDA